MSSVSVHNLNDKVTVSLTALPGFRKMGTCVVRDEKGNKSGLVTIYYVGDLFQDPEDISNFEPIRKTVLKLALNHAVKNKLGVATTRFNLTVALRERASRFKPCGSPEAARQVSIH